MLADAKVEKPVHSIYQEHFSEGVSKLQKPTDTVENQLNAPTSTKQPNVLPFQAWPQHGKGLGRRHVTFLRAELLRKKRKKVLEEIRCTRAKTVPCEHLPLHIMEKWKDATRHFNDSSIRKNLEEPLSKLEYTEKEIDTTIGSLKRMKKDDTGECTDHC